MSPHIHMSSSGVAHSNDFSAHKNATTTNNIYLHPGPNQEEFEDWMRKIGSLLQIRADYATLKPALELIVALFEPSRLFVIHHPALAELGVDSMIEILVLLDETQISVKKRARAVLRMACLKESNVVIHFESANKVETKIKNGHLHYSTCCTEDNLVFSSSPYRLPKPEEDALNDFKAELPQHLEKILIRAELFLVEAEDLAKRQLSNIAALMLHQCLGYIYKNVLFFYIRKVYNTNHLTKLHPEIGKFLPQVYAQISLYTIEILDDISKCISAPLYEVEENWDVQTLLEDIKKVLEISKVTIDRRIELYNSNTH